MELVSCLSVKNIGGILIELFPCIAVEQINNTCDNAITNHSGVKVVKLS